jgi:DNA polymerase-1
VDAFLAAQSGQNLAVALSFGDVAPALVAEEPEEESDPEPAAQSQMSFGEAATTTSKPAEAAASTARIAIAVADAAALSASVDSPAGTRLRELLADPARPKALHNYKAAIHATREHGLTLAGIADEPMLYSYLLNPTYSSHALPDLAIRELDARLSGGAAEVADFAGRLVRKLKPEVEQRGLQELYTTMDLPLVPVLARMEQAGVKLDTAVLGEMSTRLEREADTKAREIFEIVGSEFNINSPKQLGDILFNRLQLSPPGRGPKGKQASTAADVLEQLALVHPVPRLVIEFRQFSKLKSTYVDALPQLIDPRTGRVHTTFDQTGTATGRISSLNPNLQNIPIRTELGREIRAAFVAEPGHVLLGADYSQIELRLLAHLSQDPLLVEAYRRGDDIHTLTAAEVFGVPPMMITSEHRRQAKAVNFGIVYGLSPFGLAQQLGIEQKEAKRYIEAYFQKYAGVRTFIERTLEEARRDNQVRTLFGRVRPIPDIHSKNPNLRGFAERTAVNTPLQGTAADLIKVAMLRIDAALHERGMRSRMTLQVHDELVFEVPEQEVDAMRVLVQEQMEGARELSVPLVAEVGVGRNWRDME